MLTKQKEDFCYYFCQNYNATEAYRMAFNAEGKTPRQCQANASKIFKQPEVQERINELRNDKLKELKVDADRVTEKLALIAFAPADDEYYTSTAQLKALELLGRSLSMFTDKMDVGARIETVYFIEDIKKDAD